jgi:amidase
VNTPDFDLLSQENRSEIQEVVPVKTTLITITALLLGLLALAACGTKTPASTQEPTPEPTAVSDAAEAKTEVPATLEQDLALFQQAAAGSTQRLIGAVSTSCLETLVPGGRQFPLAEPDYDAKRPRDLGPFAEALAGFTSERASELDSLLAAKTVPDIQELMDDGQLSSAELVTYYIDRIQRYDVDKLNSVMELNPDALTIAAQLDEERAGGAARGPMHGIPVLLKDNIATGDQMHTTAGAFALKDWQADRDAFLVKQLRDAGAIIMGKANLSEWANYMDPCMPSGFSALGGQARHPYGPFDPLGSSTGSAVSVASNLTTMSVGSETSGSLIQPSRVNSVVGLRPSQGLVSRDYVVPLGPDLDTPGPIGRSLTDVAIMLTIMAGVDENDAKTSDAASLAGVDFTQFLSLEEAQKLRVGVIMPNQAAKQGLQGKQQLIKAVLGKELSEEELQALLAEVVLPELGGDPTAAIEALKAQGIEVVEIDDATLPPAVDTAQPQLPYGFQDAVASFFAGLGAPAPISSLADVVAVNNKDLANRAPYGQRFVEWSAETEMTAEEYERVLAVAQTIADNWIKNVLQTNNVDVLVSGMSYAGNAGAAGVPALTIPAGLDPKGQPQGVVLSGDYLSEPQLFAVGYALEQALKGRVEPDLDAVISTFP